MLGDGFHGYDGFGDVPDPSSPDLSHTQKEHAVHALIRLADRHPGYFHDTLCTLMLTPQ